MADWIIEHMLEHTTYLEPYFGSGAVFFNKESSALETINDLDGDVVNLFKVIRDHPEDLANKVKWTPYSREEYYNPYHVEGEGDEFERARRCFWFGAGWRGVEKYLTEPDGSITSTYQMHPTTGCLINGVKCLIGYCR
ncbi:DNA adenine methylase [Brevibacillus sp. NPDC058079]|uniref:DNA adenine methylase n=1 Tax=Brevibacillus sp. NPDC058079 TaxID=3346330 RepID=UPI0036E69BB9